LTDAAIRAGPSHRTRRQVNFGRYGSLESGRSWPLGADGGTDSSADGSADVGVGRMSGARALSIM
jgi:hypothetical protein